MTASRRNPAYRLKLLISAVRTGNLLSGGFFLAHTEYWPLKFFNVAKDATIYSIPWLEEKHEADL